MRDLISIIVPVYNHAHTLERCLSSICHQTYRPIEAIVVNDGSTDSFSGIIDDLKIKYDFSSINQENKGASAARNRGLREAKGKYVIFWDADTVAVATMLEKMVDALEKNKDASYAYSQFQFGWKKIKSHEFDPELLKKINYIDSTALVCKEDLPAKGWDESLKRFQDWDLWLTMLEDGKRGVFVPELLYKKIVSGRKGISGWLPSWIFKLPWKTKGVKEYNRTKKIIQIKHKL